jgi:FkbM family methyltransferase
MNLLDKIGLTKDISLTHSFDKNILINLNLNDWIQKQIFYFGRYEIEKNETLFWQNIIKPKQYVFDIGANIGYYTLQALARVGSEGRVFSFEPVAATFKKLRDNINLNNFSNAIIEKLALLDKRDKIELYIADETSIGSSSISMHVNFSGEKEFADAISLDEYVIEKNINKIDIIKIDVEGCESRVIEGMKNVMNSFKPLILIEVNQERLQTTGSSKEKLFEQFYINDFEAFEIISANEIKRIFTPKEGILILFKHKSKSLPEYIRLFKDN